MPDFLNDDEFKLYSTLIYDESGIHFSSTNRSILESRLRERLRLTELDNVAEYYNLIKSDDSELKVLLDSVTTNLTRFFRNTAHFQTLENYVLPEVAGHKKKTGSGTFRVWCAGCSTGEEPYSIAIVSKEILPSHIKVEIIASDLSLKSLMVCKEGFYPDTRISGVPEKYLKRYFEKKGDGYRVVDEIRKIVRFDYHNLKHESGQTGLDLVFCRNVIIYFDEAAQKSVVEKFWRAMNDHSYLFIGHSESLFGMNTNFEFLKTDWSTIYRKFQ